MSNKFDELTKGLAQSVTRRQALKKFSLGLAGMAIACFGLASKAKATTYKGFCVAQAVPHLGKGHAVFRLNGSCCSPQLCAQAGSADCVVGDEVGNGKLDSCGCVLSNRVCSITL